MDIIKTSKIALIESINSKFDLKQSSSLQAFDNAAVIAADAKTKQVCTEIFLEGIHFNLVYTPLKHLAHKAVTAAVSKIVAMNGSPQQILVSLGISSKFKTEDVELFYEGIKSACSVYGLDLLGNSLVPSLTGLTVAITCIGETGEKNLCCRNGAKINDLICISGSVGAACMGLQILERERYVFEKNPDVQPKLDGYDYVLQKQLYPVARIDMIKMFEQTGIKPTSMTDISECLASDLLHICKQSNTGARIYLEKIPIASETFAVCDEMNFDAVTAALNGGDDFELLFTIPVTEYERIKNLADFEIIGYITDVSLGAYLITPEGAEIKITAQGWTSSDE
ncbi:MAG: thiamine-phosphate kinase [Prevotellaceae bacterium]|jgi:thiamine-monophosphate kinase|nr:thiamine-phosphate kinase [Prevotellaceae bacterium]